MSGIDDISARLAVLETIMRQLIAHLAVRTDDPPGWVETRKALALRVIEDDVPGDLPAERYAEAISRFFRPLEVVARDYGADLQPGASQGTPRPSRR